MAAELVPHCGRTHPSPDRRATALTPSRQWSALSAAAAALRATSALLEERQADEATAIRAGRAAAADPLKSPSFGRRHALGGHGDPTAGAIDTISSPPRPNPYARLETEIREQLHNVAKHLPLPGRLGDVYRIHQAFPGTSPAADACRLFLDRLDGRISRMLVVQADRQLVPRVPGDTAGLSMRRAPDPAERVVECVTCGAAWLWSEMTRSEEAA
ncbi:hypothetical protein ACIA5D_36975 [Actinoplanes sp. NPDC051513]|uniref:hypothetical protein n=1 Tax=Actinoplanes sp. NPDC051513 TaxID=3363908 RepID=UPI003798C533